MPTNAKDITRAALLRKLGEQYFNNKPDTSLLLYNESLELSRSLSDAKYEALLLINLGNTYSNLGDARKALKYYALHAQQETFT